MQNMGVLYGNVAYKIPCLCVYQLHFLFQCVIHAGQVVLVSKTP
jgi:hypothetical protein